MNAILVPIDAPELHASRLPPFGREFASGRATNVYVYSGMDAWNHARARRDARGPGSTMLLPPGESPEAFYWPLVPNGVLVIANNRAAAFALARAIVSCGTPLAFAIFGDNEALIVRSSAWSTPLESAA